MKLKLFIQGQRLKKAKNDYIVADSKNFISADFEFSQEWTNMQKSAIFKNADTAYTVLLTDNECAVPYEVTGADFCVSVFGVKDNMRITTDEIVIRVEETGYCEGETPPEPTQSVYEQIAQELLATQNHYEQTQEVLLTKADEEEVATALSLKADKEEIEQMLLTKAEALKTDTEAKISALELSASQAAESLQGAIENVDIKRYQNSQDILVLQGQIDEINSRAATIEEKHNEDIQSVEKLAYDIGSEVTGVHAKIDNVLEPAINEVQQEVVDLQDVVTNKADISYVDDAISAAIGEALEGDY